MNLKTLHCSASLMIDFDPCATCGLLFDTALSLGVTAEPLLMLADSTLAAAAEAALAEAATAEESLFSISGVMTLGMLIVLQAVLGFDNLLYISIESKRVEASKQSMVRKWGIGLAIVFRIILLFVVVNLIKLLEEPFLSLVSRPLEMHVSGHSLIVIGGGAFILWTAIKEIYHMLAISDLEHHDSEAKAGNSVAKAIGLIVAMNLVFSFDSILSAMALTKSFAIMATAIIFSGLLMIWLADHVAEFLKKNRMYEVLGLFILFIVGVMLVSEGGHLAGIQLFGYHVTPMAKSTFYFVLVVLIIVDVVQGRYQKKLLAQQERLQSNRKSTA
jgi:predicted tellurium resistance membrane protein TerC